MANEVKLYPLMRCGYKKEPLAVTENGTYDVKSYSKVTVNVEGGETEAEPITLAEYSGMMDAGTYETDKIYNVTI